MKLLMVILLLPLLLSTSKLGATEISSSYCSSFLKNVKSSFAQGIEHLDQSQHYLAYDAFGETLTRIRAESKHLNDCEIKEKEKMVELKEESARTLTALREQM